ncbi:alpha/beta fold hydrolase [Elioraea sp.]|uniref:alpha/beta fold hydrolase n=1 Tax=Elioraea sp. TaxID=2185103 RepID=UPI0025C26344|nr:alpha/beta fold hydrolase [Elioraea sp.]
MALPLHVTQLGDGPPLLVLHGLFGHGGNWGGIAKHLAARHRVLLADLRNHGASPHDARMDYPAMAGDIAALISGQGVPMTVLGHSMGGKAAMLLALTEPALVSRLVVVDIAPRRYPSAFAPYAAAMAAIPLRPDLRRTEADATLRAAVPDAGVRAFLLQNLRFGEGAPSWRCNLPVIAASLDAISDFPALADDARWEGEALFIGGENSTYIDAAGRAAALARFPAAAFAVIPDAGHWVHAEAPEAFLRAILPFLDRGRG